MGCPLSYPISSIILKDKYLKMLRSVEAAKGSLPTDPIYFTNLACQNTPEICSVKEASEKGEEYLGQCPTPMDT